MTQVLDVGAPSTGLAVGSVRYGRAVCMVPFALQPADPLSRLFSNHNVNVRVAEVEAWCIYERLVSVPEACSVVGVVIVLHGSRPVRPAYDGADAGGGGCVS